MNLVIMGIVILEGMCIVDVIVLLFFGIGDLNFFYLFFFIKYVYL